MVDIQQNGVALPRPFPEESESVLMAIYEFDESFSQDQLKKKGAKLKQSIEKQDIVIDQVIIDNNNSGMVIVNLGRTNSIYGEIKDLRDAGMKINGYNEMTLSSVVPDQISRMGRD